MRFSILTNSALYRLRLMGTYAVPENDKGWSYAFSASAREKIEACGGTCEVIA